jgi:hypothetical protein
MSYSGYYILHHTEKYKGTLSERGVKYLSLWERNVIRTLDNNSNVLAWLAPTGNREMTIPYISPVDKKLHRYVPDFFVKVIDRNKEEKRFMLEIKPKRQTEPPKIPKRKTRAYYKACQTYAINIAKWQAAAKWCDSHHYTFKLMTEKECEIS